MPLKILLAAADDSEAEAIRNMHGTVKTESGFSAGRCDVTVIVTGIGGIATAWSLTKWFSSNPRPDLAINAGIAGSYRRDIYPGDVVMPVTDLFSDAGIETAKGFLTLGEAGFESYNQFPFVNGRIIAENMFVEKAAGFLRPVNAITVSTVTGTDATIDRLRSKYDPDIETMEGASFFYVCSKERIPFIAFRSVSNMVEPRNRGTWKISLALEKLSESLFEFLTSYID